MKKLLLTAILFLSSASMVSADADGEFNGHHYYLVDGNGIDWIEAYDICKEYGGHLATITSAAEQKFIESLLRQGKKNSYWLGGYQDDSGKWNWITDENFYYTNWNYGEPNNATGSEDCLMIYREISFGLWNDAAYNGESFGNPFFYTENFGFICEWDE